MDVDKLYDYLLLAKGRNEFLIVTFYDGDKYHLSNIDLCFSSTFDGSRENEPLVVDFEQCLNEPTQKLKAYQDGRLRTAGVYWTSIEPVVPVGKAYEVENVVAIWDDTKSYFLFDRGTPDG
jgi:hypothetical protein